jgi:hypothetical protein
LVIWMLWRLLSFLLLLNVVSAQSFFYSYIDPCEQTIINSTFDVNADKQGFQVTYYNRTKFFTLEEVLNGDLEVWAQNVYKDFEDLFPCAVKVAEEILSSVIAENVSEQFSKEEDISTEPLQPKIIKIGLHLSIVFILLKVLMGVVDTTETLTLQTIGERVH